MLVSFIQHSILKTKKKNILNGISIYFNPGELNAIMGVSGTLYTPSTISKSHFISLFKGSGKTTLLDILTGRRNTDAISVSCTLTLYHSLLSAVF